MASIGLFYRYIQQGIAPSKCIEALPPDEEAAFVAEMKEVLAEYDRNGGKVGTGLEQLRWVIHKLFHYPKELVDSLDTQLTEAFRQFITGSPGGTEGFPLSVYNCNITGQPLESHFGRFLGFFEKTPREREYLFERWDYASDTIDPFPSIISEWAPTTLLSDLRIFVYKQSKYNETYGPGKAKDELPDRNTGEMKTFKDTFYIVTNDNINFDINENSIVYTIYGKDIYKRILPKDLFTADAVIDIHPWLMYMLMTTPPPESEYTPFNQIAFDGNMAPSKSRYNLAYYIIAHYVANKDYTSNPSVFYKLPDSQKLPTMIATLKKDKCRPDDLLTAGYRWLNKGGVKEARSSIKELIAGNFGISVSKGGKRVTRRLRK